MSNPHNNRRFSRIETEARMPDGSIVRQVNEYPDGVGKTVYDQTDAELVARHGNEGSRTIGTFMEETNVGNLDGNIRQSHDHSKRFFEPK